MVIKNLIIINVLVWIAELTFGGKFIELLALHYHKSPNFHIWQLVTHMFVHSPKIGHLFWNMFALYMFGATLEENWGPKRFLLFYLFCGVGAALIQLGVLAVEMNYLEYRYAQLGTEALQEQFQVRALGIYYFSAVGASGALNGVMAAFAYLFPNYPLQMFLIPIPIKVKYLVIGYFLIDLFAGVNPQQGDNVAHIAHVGGAIVGLILVITMNKNNRRTFY